MSVEVAAWLAAQERERKKKEMDKIVAQLTGGGKTISDRNAEKEAKEYADAKARRVDPIKDVADAAMPEGIDQLRFHRDPTYQAQVRKKWTAVARATPGTREHALALIDHAVGQGWREDRESLSNVQRFLYAREQSGGVSGGDTRAAIDAIQRGDFRKLKGAVQQRVSEKYGQDPGRGLGLPFEVGNLLAAIRSNSPEVEADRAAYLKEWAKDPDAEIDLPWPANKQDSVSAATPGDASGAMAKGGTIPIDTAIKMLEERSGMPIAEFARKHGTGLAVQNRKARRAGLVAEQESLNQPDSGIQNFQDLGRMIIGARSAQDEGKHPMQMIGEGLGGAVSAPIEKTMEFSSREADRALRRAAEEHGIDYDSMMESIDAQQYMMTAESYGMLVGFLGMIAAAAGAGQPWLMGANATNAVGTTIGALDYGSLGLNWAAKKFKLGTEGAQEQAGRFVDEWIKSIDPTDKKGWEAALSFVDLFGTTVDTVQGAKWVREKINPARLKQGLPPVPPPDDGPLLDVEDIQVGPPQQEADLPEFLQDDYDPYEDTTDEDLAGMSAEERAQFEKEKAARQKAKGKKEATFVPDDELPEWLKDLEQGDQAAPASPELEITIRTTVDPGIVKRVYAVKQQHPDWSAKRIADELGIDRNTVLDADLDIEAQMRANLRAEFDSKGEGASDAAKEEVTKEANRQISNAQKDYANGIIDEQQRDAIIAEAQKRISVASKKAPEPTPAPEAKAELDREMAEAEQRRIDREERAEREEKFPEKFDMGRVRAMDPNAAELKPGPQFDSELDQAIYKAYWDKTQRETGIAEDLMEPYEPGIGSRLIARDQEHNLEADYYAGKTPDQIHERDVEAWDSFGQDIVDVFDPRKDKTMFKPRPGNDDGLVMWHRNRDGTWRIDGRMRVRTVSVSGLPDYILRSLFEYIQNGFRSPEYRLTDVATYNKWRREGTSRPDNLMTVDEYALRDSGGGASDATLWGKSEIPAIILKQYIEDNGIPTRPPAAPLKGKIDPREAKEIKAAYGFGKADDLPEMDPDFVGNWKKKASIGGDSIELHVDKGRKGWSAVAVVTGKDGKKVTLGGVIGRNARRTRGEAIDRVGKALNKHYADNPDAKKAARKWLLEEKAAAVERPKAKAEEPKPKQEESPKPKEREPAPAGYEYDAEGNLVRTKPKDAAPENVDDIGNREAAGWTTQTGPLRSDGSVSLFHQVTLDDGVTVKVTETQGLESGRVQVSIEATRGGKLVLQTNPPGRKPKEFGTLIEALDDTLRGMSEFAPPIVAAIKDRWPKVSDSAQAAPSTPEPPATPEPPKGESWNENGVWVGPEESIIIGPDKLHKGGGDIRIAETAPGQWRFSGRFLNSYGGINKVDRMYATRDEALLAALDRLERETRKALGSRDPLNDPTEAELNRMLREIEQHREKINPSQPGLPPEPPPTPPTPEPPKGDQPTTPEPKSTPEPKPKTVEEKIAEKSKEVTESGEFDAALDRLREGLKNVNFGKTTVGVDLTEIFSKQYLEDIYTVGVELMRRGITTAKAWLVAFSEVLGDDKIVDILIENGFFSEVKRRFDAERKRIEDELNEPTPDTPDTPTGSDSNADVPGGRPEGVSPAGEGGNPAPDVRGPGTESGSGARGSDDGSRDASDGSGRSGAGEQPDATPEPAAEPGAEPAPIPTGKDFRTDAVTLNLPKTDGERVKALTEALDALEAAEKRGYATPEEQLAMARFPGWGWTGNRLNRSHPEFMAEVVDRLERLDPNAYTGARKGVLTSYFTPPAIIRPIWNKIKEWGFDGGKVLEPSVGVGAFVMHQPEGMKGDFTMVEIDPISARIAKMLYPESKVHQKGFEEWAGRGNYQLVVGNVPFGAVAVHDPKLQASVGAFATSSIHNYFIVKSVDQLAPGGIAFLVTSRHTMDAASPDAMAMRGWLAENADLLGAVRMPSGTFINAGTNVVADLLVIRKRVNPTKRPVNWVESKTVDVNGTPFRVNNYFVENPTQVLGAYELGKGENGRAELNIKSDPSSGSYVAAIDRLPNENWFGFVKDNETTSGDFVEPPPGSRIGSFFKVGSTWYVNDAGGGGLAIDKQHHALVESYSNLNSELTNLISLNRAGATDAELGVAQSRTLQAYKDHVKAHGAINANKKQQALLSNDPNYWAVAALENWDADQQKVSSLSDIFTRRVLGQRPLDSAPKTPGEAIVKTVAATGRFDVKAAAAALNKPVDEFIKEAGDLLFRDPKSDEWVMAEDYGIGNIKQKLDDARKAADEDEAFARNVEFLEKRMPSRITIDRIVPKLGSPWIKPDIVAAFMKSALGFPHDRFIKAHYSPQTAKWSVTVPRWMRDRAESVRIYGTEEMPFHKLLTRLLNLQEINVYLEGQIHPGLTEQARAAAERIQDYFEKIWIMEDPARATRLEQDFNDSLNVYNHGTYDGSHLSLEGFNPSVTPRPHQLGAAWRQIIRQATLLAHEVGTGKTISMMVAGMEMKRMGVRNKIVYAVPNSTISDFVAKFQGHYPGARLLVLNEDNFKPSDAKVRKTLVAKAMVGDYDAIIMPHHFVAGIPLSPQKTAEYIQEQINRLRMWLEQEGEDLDTFTVRETETLIENYETDLRDQMERIQQNADPGTYWDDIGIDYMFVDEAHEFKNAQAKSKVGTESKSSGSQRAEDLMSKTNLLHVEGGGITLSTGTPLTNKVAEIYTMMRYLAPDILDDQGFTTFDAWLRTFGEPEYFAERNAGLDFTRRRRVRRFKNMSAMQRMWRQFADVVFAEDTALARPKMVDAEGNVTDKPIINVVEPSEAQRYYFRDLLRRFRMLTGDRAEDNVLKITDNGSNASTDERLMDLGYLPEGFEQRDYKRSYELPDGTKARNVEVVTTANGDGSAKFVVTADHGNGEVLHQGVIPRPKRKAEAAADNVWRIYNKQEVADNKGAQVIFIDRGVPGGQKFNLYAEIKRLLVEKGIPESEIAFATDYKDRKKQTLWNKVNSGEIRVLITSTALGGQGNNYQARLAAAHHLDAGTKWQPADLEQRNGRILRQGNLFEKFGVEVHYYITSGSYDQVRWQSILGKAETIKKFMRGDDTVDEIVDDADDMAGFGEIYSHATGDPRIAEYFNLQSSVRDLQAKADGHARATRVAAQEADTFERTTIPQTERLIQVHEEGKGRLTDRGEKFVVEMNGRQIEGHKAVGEQIATIAPQVQLYDRSRIRMSHRGIDLRVSTETWGTKYFYVLTASVPGLRELEWHKQLANYGETITEAQWTAIGRWIDERAAEIDKSIVRLTAEKERLTEQVGLKRKQAQSTFADQEKLDSMRARLEVLEAEVGDVQSLGGGVPGLGMAVLGSQDEDEKRGDALILGGLSALAIFVLRAGGGRRAFMGRVRNLATSAGANVARFTRIGDVAWIQGLKRLGRAATYEPRTLAARDTGGSRTFNLVLNKMLNVQQNWRPRYRRDIDRFERILTKHLGRSWGKEGSEGKAILDGLRDKLESKQPLTEVEESIVNAVEEIHAKFGPWAWELGIGIAETNDKPWDELVGRRIRTKIEVNGKKGTVEAEVDYIAPDGSIVFTLNGDEYSVPPGGDFQRPINELGTSFVPRILRKEFIAELAKATNQRLRAAKDLHQNGLQLKDGTKKEFGSVKEAMDYIDLVARAREMHEGRDPIWFNAAKRFNEIAEEIFQKNRTQFSTIHDAKEWLQTNMEALASENDEDITTFMAGLERARKLQFASEHYVQNYAEAFSTYLNRAHKRIAIAEELQTPDPRVLANLLSVVSRDDPARGAYLRAFISRALHLGREFDDRDLKMVARAEGSIQTVTKLTGGTTQMAQISDLVQVMTRTNTSSWVKGLYRLATDQEFRNESRALAGTLRKLMAEIDVEDRSGRLAAFADGVMTWTGLKAIDQAVRTSSMSISLTEVHRLLKRGQKLTADDAALAKRLGITDADLLKGEDAFLDERFRNRVGAAIRKDLTYTGNVEDNPLWMSSPGGMMFMRIRKPVYYVTRFVLRDVLNEAAFGNFKPLVKLLVIGGIAGEGIAEVKEFLTGRERDLEDAFLEDTPAATSARILLARAVNNLMDAGTLGIAKEATSTYSWNLFGKFDLLKLLVPVSLGDATTWAGDASQMDNAFVQKLREIAGQEEPEGWDFWKTAERSVPLIKRYRHFMGLRDE